MKYMKNEVTSYLENISLFILGIFLIIFPVFLLTQTTDPLVLPKQILFTAVILLLLFLSGAKMISEGKVMLRRTPFDLPVGLFALVAIVSTVLAVNRFDSLIALVPLILSVLSYFVVVNLLKDKSSVLFLVSTLVLGGCLLSIFLILTFFKIYVLPIDFTKVSNFSPLGNLLDQALYLAFILPLAAYPFIKGVKELGKFESRIIGFGISSLIILVGLSIAIYQLTLQKPLLLPLETGFQTAFAAISQDTARILQGFLFGSGFGTYMVDFTRFKSVAFNLNPALWSYTFFRSSNFILEILATMGILGLASFLFIIWKVIRELKISKVTKENIALPSILLILIFSFIFPLSFTSLAILFIVLGIFAAYSSLLFAHEGHTQKRFFDVEFSFVAFKRQSGEAKKAKFLPVSLFLLFILFIGAASFYIGRYVASDIQFQNSLVFAAKNQGVDAYNSQLSAINVFPYRDSYYRVFSQTNLALANSLVSQQPKNSSPSANTQTTVTTLIQQSINTARNATAISPQNALNWQNLSSVYRSLIGFGKDAEKFAILANQQAISLDPNNPQQYINLGGIYYGLGQWEAAQNQFQIAVNLKPDFANAYYNLGHSLEQKGDFKNALSQYQIVKTLVNNDPANSKKISEEIDTLQNKIGSAEQISEESATKTQNSAMQKPLEISTPTTQLPEQKPPVNIPPPPNATQAAQ